MKQQTKKLLLSAAAWLTIGSISLSWSAVTPIHASTAYGEMISSTETNLHDGTVLYHRSYRDDGVMQQERYIAYNIGGNVKPLVTFGEATTSLQSVMTAAQQLENRGLRVVGGINGDYYGVANGVPLGTVMSEGTIRSATTENYAVGFLPDGSAVLGKPNLRMTVSGSYTPVPPPLTPGETAISYAAAGTDTVNITQSDETSPSKPRDTVVAANSKAANTKKSAFLEDRVDTPSNEEPTQTDHPNGQPAQDHESDLPSGSGNRRDVSFELAAINHIRYSYSGIYLYTRDFNTRRTTGTNAAGIDLVCSVVSGQLRIGTPLILRVEQVLPNAVNTVVEEGTVIITANHEAGEQYTSVLRSIPVGTELTLDIQAEDPIWNNVENMVGALYALIEDGTACKEPEAGYAPRTAIGQRADGSLILYTADGRQTGYSRGASFRDVTNRLLELGCIRALSLDGGGSTTMVATMPEAMQASLQNSPSDGRARAVTNHIFLVADGTPTGIPQSVYIHPIHTPVLSHTTLPLQATLLDSNRIPMENADFTYRSDFGSITENQWTAPSDTGIYTVSAHARNVDGERQIAVYDTPDAIVLQQNGSAVSSIVLMPGETISLTALAYINETQMISENSSFQWTLDGNAGTLGENYQFTAADHVASGTLQITAGERQVDIPIQITIQPQNLLADFETPFDTVSAPSSAATNDQSDFDGSQNSENNVKDMVISENEINSNGANVYDNNITSPETNAETDVQENGEVATYSIELSHSADTQFVKSGKGSAKLIYTTGEDGSAIVPLSIPLPQQQRSVSMWIYGNDSAFSLSLMTDRGESEKLHIILTDWQHITLPIPDNSTHLNGILLGGIPDQSGILYLDQITAAPDLRNDTTPPQIELAIDENNLLHGYIYDKEDGTMLSQLSLQYDGSAYTFLYDATNGFFSAQLPEADTLVHRITVTAGDVGGNLSRSSFDRNGDLSRFTFHDTAEHSARNSIDYLLYNGVTIGDGEGYFHPESYITRQEFAILLRRHLVLPDAPAEMDFPFTDVDFIADWAREDVRAIYAQGIITGSKDLLGNLIFAPQNSISRAEAATIVGRLLERGFAVTAPNYSDSSLIPSWAFPHVELLGSLHILTGRSDGNYAPNDAITRAEVAQLLHHVL